MNGCPDHCPFCAISADRTVESSKHAFVVSDAFPVSPGHSLVISRSHVPDIFDLAPVEVDDMLRLIRSTRERIDRDLQPAGYNIGVNIGKDAGQTIMHVHVHIIPRYAGDVDDPRGGVRSVIPGKVQYP
jgi:diadenosine tetraphosphate (Ap4A) HIT family hydrolase